MRFTLLAATLLLLPALTGCIVPENMTALREELGYASVELPDVVVKLRADTLTARTDQPVTFEASIEGIQPGAAQTTWRFGDGTNATGPTAEHAWAEAGTYTVEVTVQPPEGPAATDAVQVRVLANSPPAPVIEFPEDGPPLDGEAILLSAASSEDADGDELAFTWKVDGEQVGTGPQVRATLSAGQHAVELIASDGWTEVAAFTEIGVALPLQKESRLTPLEDTAEVAVPVQAGAAGLTVELVHTSLAGLEDVRLLLLSPDGETVATSDQAPEVGASQGTESLDVAGSELAEGTYTLRAQLVQGASIQVSLDGLLTYGP